MLTASWQYIEYFRQTPAPRKIENVRKPNLVRKFPSSAAGLQHGRSHTQICREVLEAGIRELLSHYQHCTAKANETTDKQASAHVLSKYQSVFSTAQQAIKCLRCSHVLAIAPLFDHIHLGRLGSKNLQENKRATYGKRNSYGKVASSCVPDS